MQAGFEYYRAFPINAEQNKELSETKLQMPVLVLGGDIYPALGGDFPGNLALTSTQLLAANVTGVTVPLSGLWIPEYIVEPSAIVMNRDAAAIKHAEKLTK